VQGGNYKEEPVKVPKKEVKDNVFTSVTNPRNWAELGPKGLLTGVKMTQRASFVSKGAVLKIEFGFECNDKRCKQFGDEARHQEVPAVFIQVKRLNGTLLPAF
jgi:hypothetical protein